MNSDERIQVVAKVVKTFGDSRRTPKLLTSFATLKSGQPSRQEKHEFLYWEFQEKQAVRMGDWKAVRLGGEDGRLELYDLKSDIGEKQDLSQRHPGIIARIREILNTSHDAPGI